LISPLLKNKRYENQSVCKSVWSLKVKAKSRTGYDFHETGKKKKKKTHTIHQNMSLEEEPL